MSSLNFRLKKIDETINHLLEEVKHNDLMGEKYKNTYKYLNYVEYFLFLASTNISYDSVSEFASLVCVPVCITSSAVGLKICAITVGIKRYKSVIKKKKKKHDKIVLLGKDKLNTIKVLFSKALINSYIRHDQFLSVNNVLREYNEMKEEKKLYVTYDIKKSSSAARRTRHRLGNTSTCVSIYNKVIISQRHHRYPAAAADFVILYKTMETYCVSCKKILRTKIRMLEKLNNID